MLSVRLAAVALFLLRLGSASASAAEIPKGRILPQVACAADPTQTYALYIPTSFDPARLWPVLYCFDPGARGKAAVEHFQAAAEKYGWLVAGSNTSRNGPWEPTAKAIDAMLTDVTRHLPVDPRRAYAAGLSGGARVACQIAVLGLARGVIACSAGFSGSETPDKVPFFFFGTAGATDFNHRELRRVDRELDDRHAAHRVVFFDGGHEWLPAPLALEALGWIELQEMRTGVREPHRDWIQQQWEARLAAVPAAPPVPNVRALRALAADFKGLVDVTTYETQARERAATREFKAAQKAERAAEQAEDNLTDKLLAAATDGVSNATRKTVADLQARAEAPASPDQEMATRVLHGVAASCGEAAREAMRQRDFSAAASALELAVVLRPDRPQGFFELARARAESGDRKRALAALEQAVAAGFKDRSRLDGERAFDRLRADPAFLALRAKLP
jgi:predicted esterase